MSDRRDKTRDSARPKHHRKPSNSKSKGNKGKSQDTDESTNTFDRLNLGRQRLPGTSEYHAQGSDANVLCELPCGLGVVQPEPPPRGEPVQPEGEDYWAFEEYQRDREQWEREYATWKGYTCDCKNAYFCKAHGQWVSGEAVRKGNAASQANETPDTCHKNGYFCEAHNEWVSEDEVLTQQSPQRSSQTSSTCHWDGYFCEAHNRWVSGVLIRYTLAAEQSVQTSNTCHPRNQAVPPASWFTPPTNSCKSGHGKPSENPELQNTGSSTSGRYAGSETYEASRNKGEERLKGEKQSSSRSDKKKGK